MNLLDLPTELLLLIIRNLVSDKDISAFVRTNSFLYDSLSNYLYQNNALRHNGSALLWAAEHGVPQAALRSLSNGGRIECRTLSGKHTPLSLATGTGNEELVRILLAHGADINHLYYSPGSIIPNETALMKAASAGHDVIVQLLLDHGAPIDWSPKYQKTPICLAAEAGRLSTVKLLLTRGANPRLPKSNLADTPLAVAVSHGYPEIVDLLIQHGANVRHQNRNGNTLLSDAVEKQHWETAKVLLKNGAKVDKKDSRGLTALNNAARSNNIAGARLLIEHGAQVNTDSWLGETPLFAAARRGHEDMAKLLINNGADINSLSKLVSHEHPSVYEKLGELSRRKGVDYSYTRSIPVTPLLVAAANGNEAMCRLLIDNGAEVNYETLTAMTLECLAEAYGYHEIKSLIEKATSGQESESTV
ncbi:ankyrin repeat-containing domain protein [Aspergillus minisclerotigenes]|uniref:Ankyrin repeat-containing domain protein n=1 Tax=Aspergillus minisclerotigenes TaxID=656917 RepID=A0A5N6JD77_9EURO|nr:ankyrin repeat-containing domain protein [Aspergillus minisclerotigenes]